MSVYPTGADVVKTADLSDDGVYRYSLSRWWATDTLDLPREARSLTFIMLNPSTADADVDDPTIRRCVGFARRMGYPGIGVLNLYAYRATKPAALWEADRTTDIIGPHNDDLLAGLLRDAANVSSPVVAAWGAGAKSDRAATVTAMGAGVLHHLGLTKAGHPRHPLYVPSDTPLTPWSPA